MRFRALITFVMLFFVSLATAREAGASRVKDIATVYGDRDNVLSGYGIVTGLNRSGDSARNEVTVRSLVNRLQGLGVTLTPDQIQARNVAVVMVTTRMPSSARPGHRLDVEVSSAGDATSLEGGILLLTPLYAPNGAAFAAAQGPLVVGGFKADNGQDSSRRNYPLVARVPQGGTVERENPQRLNLATLSKVDWIIRQPDFTTATRLATAMNQALGGSFATALDGATVSLQVPEPFQGKVVDLIAKIEAVQVQVDAPARVVINERTGTVVMGADVTISAVAVAHGGLSIEVQRQAQVSQPAPLSQGRTTVVQNGSLKAEEDGGRLTLVEGVTIGDLVASLNALGVKPRDLIQILLTIRAAGALQAEVETL